MDSASNSYVDGRPGSLGFAACFRTEFFPFSLD